MAPTLESETVKMLIAFIVLEVFDIWMVYVVKEIEKCQLISVGVLISKLRRFKWFRTVRYMKGN